MAQQKHSADKPQMFTLTRLRRVNAELSGARLRHARLAVTPTARQPVVRVGPFFQHNQSASRPIMPEKTPLNSALGNSMKQG